MVAHQVLRPELQARALELLVARQELALQHVIRPELVVARKILVVGTHVHQAPAAVARLLVIQAADAEVPKTLAEGILVLQNVARIVVHGKVVRESLR